ncbi:MAG: hypothetical protein KKD44_26615 [Proteobacteria bacterium]|nr:hypothetical protein [Pseudomonadota bacterium]
MTSYDVALSLLASGLVLMILSFLYRESGWFSFAEHIVVGGLSGYGAAIGIKNVYYQGLTPLAQGQFWYILAIIAGLLLFAGLFKTLAWWVRVPTAIMIGTGIGLNMRAAVETQVTAQLIDTVRSINTASLTTNINNLIIVIGVCCVIMFFFFSTESKGALKPVGIVGRYFLMISLGSSFAYAVMGRTSLMIARFQDLLSYPNYYTIFLAVALVLYDILKQRKTS